MGLVLVGVSAAALLLLAAEGGYQLGRRRRDQARVEVTSQEATVQAAVLGLLALLLGFTFAMAVSRFDLRKELILEEANAIGTTYLRADVLPDDGRAALQARLRAYVDARIAFYEAGADWEAIDAAEARRDALGRVIWADVASAARAAPGAVPVGLLVASTNEMLDLSTKRLAALRNHVPPLIFVLLFTVATVAVAVTGFAAGLQGRRVGTAMMVLPVLIAAVVAATVDLDRPRVGLIRAGQSSMLNLRESLR